MPHLVEAADLTKLLLVDDSSRASILQNVAVILGSVKGTIPLYREFGVSAEYVDKPIPVASVMVISAVKEAIEQFEPRVKVISVSCRSDPAEPGRLIPSVEVDIR